MADSLAAAAKKPGPDTGQNPDNEMMQMHLGGYVLARKGEVMAVASPVAVYDNLTSTNVQAMWVFLTTNARIQAAKATYDQIMSEELTKLGDQFGIEKGRTTPEELARNREMLSRLS